MNGESRAARSTARGSRGTIVSAVPSEWDEYVSESRALISAVARDSFTSDRKVAEDRRVIFIQSRSTSSAHFPSVTRDRRSIPTADAP